jgi:excisionase family DNA binding protein
MENEMQNQNAENGEVKVMTAQEVSEYLRIPLSTVYGLTKKGTIKAVKLGKHWRYLKTEIDRYLHGMGRATSEMVERRERARINCKLPAEISMLLDKNRTKKMGVIENIGEGGVRFSYLNGNAAAREGDPVRLVLSYAGGEESRIELQGRVVHSLADQEKRVGVKFRDLSEDAREVIRAYVG